MNLTQAIPIILITGLVQVTKEAFGLPSKYAQIATFVIAVVFGVLFTVSPSITDTVITILAFGLSAIGLWEVAGPKYKELRGEPLKPVEETPKAVDSD